jgi:hypothetical protein
MQKMTGREYWWRSCHMAMLRLVQGTGVNGFVDSLSREESEVELATRSFFSLMHINSAHDKIYFIFPVKLFC